MTYLLLTIAIFAFAAGVNTGSVAFQQRTRWLTRRFGRGAWWVHMALVSPGWALFLNLEVQLGRHLVWPLPAVLWPLGLGLLVLAAVLFAASSSQLGLRRTCNGYFFDSEPPQPVSGAVYRWLENPMYDSFWIAFVGLALIEANAAYLALAVASYLLLNRCEAKIENGPFAAAR